MKEITIVNNLKTNHWKVPQPEGKEVASAYERGLLSRHATRSSRSTP
jgi:hypothetical protein